MTTATDIPLSGQLTVASGGGTASINLYTGPAANEVARLDFNELLTSLYQGGTGACTITLILTKGGVELLRWSSITTGASGSLTSTSSGAIPYSPFTLTLNADGSTTIKPNAVAPFISSSAQGTPLNQITGAGFVTSVDSAAGIKTPLYQAHGENLTLTLTVSSSANGTTYFNYVLHANVQIDALGS